MQECQYVQLYIMAPIFLCLKKVTHFNFPNVFTCAALHLLRLRVTFRKHFLSYDQLLYVCKYVPTERS